MDAIREINLDDKDWGKLQLVMAIPREGDFWGTFAPVRGTPWEETIQVVSGEVLSDALHGYATPLVRKLGRKPRDKLKVIPFMDRRCQLALNKLCFSANENCVPGTKVLPVCYEPQLEDPKVSVIVSHVAKWLDEGRYVIVVEGDEFSL